MCIIRRRFIQLIMHNDEAGGAARVAVSQHDARLPVNDSFGRRLPNNLSATGRLVPTRTLESLLNQTGIGEIDLLSADCEGCETAAFQSLDVARHRPRLVIVEIAGGHAKYALRTLARHGYLQLQDANTGRGGGKNEFLLRPDLARHLRQPCMDGAPRTLVNLIWPKVCSLAQHNTSGFIFPEFSHDVNSSATHCKHFGRWAEVAS